ncbi:MAG: Immunoglobulin I-set domain protein [Pedosphaera sp.]|nr:Immunoglobulin I-set domain protein [Pedosphaera sp.]
MKAKYSIRICIVWICLFFGLSNIYSQTLNLPPRPANAPTGSQFINIINSMPLTERENWIYAQIAAGNVPNWLRTLVPITITQGGHTLTYYVTPDYMAIGSDQDYFLEPMTPLLVQRVANLLNCTLPTRKMVDYHYTNAVVHLSPSSIPPSATMTTVPIFAQHNTTVRGQRNTTTNAHPFGALVDGDKKDVIISTRIYGNPSPGRVVIYGWHYPDGTWIQDVTAIHEETYADYSHGIRMVQMAITLDGVPNTVTNVLASATLSSLLSDEGVISVPRYPHYNLAPVIITQPRSHSVNQGNNLSLTVTALGDSPLSYQWKSNGSPVSGATNSSLSITNVQAVSAGSYTVTITNSFGSVTTIAAPLKVNTSAFPLLYSDNFDANSSANWNLFSGSGDGVSDYTVDWAYDYSAIPYTFNNTTYLIPPAPNSTNGSTKGVRFTVNNNDTNGVISGVNIYPKNQSFSNNFALKFDMWINYPGDAAGATATGSTEFAIFGINHSGTKANWAATSTPSTDGIWFGVDGEGGTNPDYRSYVGNPTGVQTTWNVPTNGMASADNAAGIYPGLFPSTRFESVGAPGKNWVAGEVSQTNGLLTWKLDGTIIAQRNNNSSFTNGNIMLGFMDIFPSIASPAADAFVIFDNVRVENWSASGLLAPAITTQPQGQTVEAGSNVTFSVTATGSNPLAYQWSFNGNPISSATLSSLTLTNVQSSNAGNYTVLVSNGAGNVPSATAQLIVHTPQVQFGPVTLLTNGQVQVTFSGVLGTEYLIEASTNLTNWKPIDVLYDGANPVTFIDPDANQYTNRYYRARSVALQTLTDFESYASGTPVMFQAPAFSASTSSFLDLTAGSIAYVTNSFPSGHTSTNVLQASWSFKVGTTNPWLRLTTFAATNLANPVIGTNQVLMFDIYTDKNLYVEFGFRETSTSNPIGSDGGMLGNIEWVGGSTLNTQNPPKGQLVTAGQWTTLQFFIPYEPVRNFVGNGILETTTGKGVLEHLCLVPVGGSGAYTLYLDNFQVVDLAP